MAPQEEKKSATERVEGSTSLLSSVSDAPKNNGIPIFIQERLDERNKKKGDVGPDEVGRKGRGREGCKDWDYSQDDLMR